MKKYFLLAFMFLSLFSFSKIESPIPRTRVELGLGAPVINVSGGRSLEDFLNLTLNLAVMPEWKANINQKFDITFGPKLSGSVTIGPEETQPYFVFGIYSEFETDFNIKITEKNKFYLGLEVGTGLIVIIENFRYDGKIMVFNGNLLIGGKINDKLNIAGHLGYTNKGIAGIRVGYTF